METCHSHQRLLPVYVGGYCTYLHNRYNVPAPTGLGAGITEAVFVVTPVIF